jgi:3-deoxy-manno-octulosonate cytidylyltransferase (CMP-KDO synthetase)
MSIIAIIPARMASSRFPGKPLKPILGLSMIEHVRRRVSLCKVLDEVIVATCDKIIFDEVQSHGGGAVMTSDCHDSCIDRVAEAASRLKTNIIINVQGDMPLVDPGSLETLVKPLLKEKNIHYTDMIAPILEKSDIHNPNIVKVVTNLSGDAIYYSREVIPSIKKNLNREQTYFMQLGINAFRNRSLRYFSELERTPLEIIESVDMLRLLEHNYDIRTVIAESPALGVDTPEDLVRVSNLMTKDTIFPNYMELSK